MSFKLGDIVVDRVLLGVAEDFDDNLLYVLSQLADANIDVTAESKDAVDATGTLVTSQGYAVMGWDADDEGNVSKSNVQPICLYSADNQYASPVATARPQRPH